MLYSNKKSQLMLMRCATASVNFIRRLSWSISSNFGVVHSWNVCHSLKSQKITKNPFLGSRSSMLVPSEKSPAVIVMIRSNSVSICSHSHAVRANSSEITIYYRVIPSFNGNLLTQHHEIWSQQTRDSTRSYGKNPESLSHLCLIRQHDMSPGQTDGGTELR